MSHLIANPHLTSNFVLATPASHLPTYTADVYLLDPALCHVVEHLEDAARAHDDPVIAEELQGRAEMLLSLAVQNPDLAQEFIDPLDCDTIAYDAVVEAALVLEIDAEDRILDARFEDEATCKNCGDDYQGDDEIVGHVGLCTHCGCKARDLAMQNRRTFDDAGHQGYDFYTRGVSRTTDRFRYENHMRNRTRDLQRLHARLAEMSLREPDDLGFYHPVR